MANKIVHIQNLFDIFSAVVVRLERNGEMTTTGGINIINLSIQSELVVGFRSPLTIAMHILAADVDDPAPELPKAFDMVCAF